MKRGMNAWSTRQIKLKWADYAKALPKVPAHFGHARVAQPPHGWGMLGNDQCGDCTIAGIAHGQMLVDWATNRSIPVFDAKCCMDQYYQLTGGPDSGLDPVQVAKYWQQHGLLDVNNDPHHCRSYTALENPQEAIEAAYCFGFSGLGLMIPDSAEAQFSAGQVWDDLNGQPAGGHYVPLVGRNSEGHLVVVTWGRLQAMTEAYLERYFMGGVAYTSADYMTSQGLSPEGYDFVQLDDDMAAL